MTKISVVVPVYNVEKYLTKCVDSILNQTYKDLEIFLVDDGATDNCPAICDQYAAQDSRVSVIHKTNGGLSDARNVAIDVATGEFITFIDSDDYVDEDMIECMYASLSNNNCDIATVRYRSFYDGDHQPHASSLNDEYVLSGEEALKDMLYQKHTTNSAWGKLYRTSLFTNIRYPFGKICEDVGTTYKLFSGSKKVVFNSAVKYHYLQRKDSIINSNFSPRRMDALDLAQEQLNYVELHHPEVVAAAKNRLFMESIYIAIEIPDDNQFGTERARCKAVIKAHCWIVLRDGESKPKFRIYAGIAVISAGLLLATFNLKKHIRKFKSTRITRSNNV